MSIKKIVGILGGMSPESTAEFYNKLIAKYYDREQNYSYPEIVIYSVDFKRMIELQESGDKTTYAKELLVALNRLENAGAEFAVIASNTPHMVFEELEKGSRIPLLSIVKSTAKYAQNRGYKKLLLLGTKFTMQSSFYKDDFQKIGIEVITPNDNDITTINRIIYDELVGGVVKSESKEQMLTIVKNYQVDGVVLGCTELPLIIKPTDTTTPLLDTLDISVDATLNYCLSDIKSI